MSNSLNTRRPRTRRASDAKFGLYPDGCVWLKMRDDRGDYVIQVNTWEEFDRIHREMAARREDRNLGLKAGKHNHEQEG